MKNNNTIKKGVCKNFKAFLPKEANGKQVKRYFSRTVICSLATKNSNGPS
jgi:hypothetical protein